jgi:hypothetical protein
MAANMNPQLEHPLPVVILAMDEVDSSELLNYDFL